MLTLPLLLWSSVNTSGVNNSQPVTADNSISSVNLIREEATLSRETDKTEQLHFPGTKVHHSSSPHAAIRWTGLQKHKNGTKTGMVIK